MSTTPQEVKNDPNLRDDNIEIGQEEPAANNAKESVESSNADNQEQETPDEEQPSLSEQVVTLKEQVVRIAADFENYRKRARREQEMTRRLATERILSEILPVIDNLTRALAHSADESNPVVDGVRMVANQFLDILEGFGVKAIEAENLAFDPEFHEAIGQCPSGDVAPGTIIEEIQKGYTLGDRLLRPCKVIVSTELASVEEESDDQ